MPRFTARERRERYLRELTFQKRTGKPFFPHAMFHDTVASLVVVGIIIGMSVLWWAQFDPVPGNPTEARNGGIMGAAYEGIADPGTEEYEPRPEWYYFFLFELLRIFKNPDLLILATVGIPTLWMILLIAWPFLDRSPERRISRRPVAMAIGAAVPVMLLALTWYGSKAPGAAGQVSDHPGALAFEANGCATCHAMADAGAVGQVGPNLDSAQPDYQSALQIITEGRGGMPSFAAQGLNEDQLRCMAGYVATWAGAADQQTPGPQSESAAADYPAACEAAGAEYAGAAAAG